MSATGTASVRYPFEELPSSESKSTSVWPGTLT
jgi:hypothetical protein